MRFYVLLPLILAAAACHRDPPPTPVAPAPTDTPRTTGGPCGDGTVLHGDEHCP